MSNKFEEFLTGYFNAIKNDDLEFLGKIYADWLETSGEVPDEQKGEFTKMIIGDLKQLAELKIDRTEEIGDFDIVYMKIDDGEFSLNFKKKGDSWIFFNEKSNFTLFKQVYAIGYAIQGGSLRVLFNGKRTIVADKIQNSGFNSIINSALEIGENEITLESVDGTSLTVSLKISSAKSGEIISTDQGNVLNWDGTVKEPVNLRFSAE
ncbi:hypothetical protein KKE92_04195 [Candidatus Micrarchaeota archaeon]|nr:hypothetical protein [Candidatus Micrarchaeota archaeon]MBU1681305.1 hypothetical protein [Candidatus Micrarchaeota archaeon]